MKAPEIETQIDRMTLDEKAGQLFILGFPQRELTPDLKKFLTRTKPGAFVIFKRNFFDLESIRKLTRDLYDLSMEQTHLPPFLAVDQEGGNVTRIPTVPAMPSALSLGQTRSPVLAEELGYETAALMRELGFNMNLAPVLDLADPARFSFIGTRSYGDDPVLVGNMGYSFSRGLIRNAVIPTAKHFPGTGSLSADPHVHATVNQATPEELEKIYLPPFERYAKLGLFSAVMVSHSIYPKLDTHAQPAVFSREIVTGLLRDRLKFRGLIMTDDLQMAASKALLKPEDAALAALKAGNDMVMLTWSFQEQEKAVERVKKGIESGELAESDLRAKLRRILFAKFYLNPNSSRTPQSEGKSVLVSPKLSQLDEEILDKNSPTVAALAAYRHKKLCVFSASNVFLRSYRQADRTKSRTFLLSSKTTTEEVTALIAANKCKDNLFVVNGSRTGKLVMRLPSSIRAKGLVLNLGLPGLIAENKFGQVLNLYFPHPNAGKKIAHLLNENYAALEK